MEAITSVDLNFTNSAGGHSATVQTILNPKNVQNGEDLGTVIGEAGEVNAFSNAEIGGMLNNFVCTEKTTSTNPTVSTVSRKYTDRTTLLLKSHMVLVRGINCGPRDEIEFEGEVPYFSEVINSPDPLKDSFDREFPFPCLGPKKYGSIIVAGKIYNYESASEYDGIKITLAYNNRQFKPELSLNDEVVSARYKLSPDLSQYDLKFGYTLGDFKTILNMAGIQIAANSDVFQLEEGEEVLFEQSGTLDSVVSAVANYFGYFWYVNPDNGTICFINTQEAINLKISDHSKTSDESIISSSFTQGFTSTKVVNAYVGTAEKPEAKSPKDDDRPRKVYFKRYDVTKDFIEPNFGRGLNEDGVEQIHEELGALFALFNQSGGARVFDNFFWLLLWENTHPDNKKITKCQQWGMKLEVGTHLNYEMLYDSREPFNHQIWFWGPNPAVLQAANPDFVGPPNLAGSVYLYDSGRYALDPKKSKSRINKTKKQNDFFDRVKDKFEYRLFNNQDPKKFGAGTKMKRPSQTDLFTFMQSYFAIAGGIYVSHAYSKYKVERMEFQNMNNITIVGPLKGDTKIEDIPDLSELNDVLTLVQTKKRVTVRDLWRGSHGKDQIDGVEPVHDFHFVAIRNIPKLERKNGADNDRIVDFRPFEKLEVYDHPIKKSHLWLGGPKKFMDRDLLNSAVSLSYSNYLEATEFNKKSLGIEYVRRKTRVNKIDENPFAEEKEDTEISESSDSEQKMSDLFDRFDYQCFFVTTPPYNLLNNLSLSSFSGSITEMKAMRKENESYAQGEGPTQNSSVTRYGLHVPTFKPQINSVSIRTGPDGIQTTVNESTIKLVPVSSTLIENRAHESVFTENGIAPYLNASARNFMGL
jgi:hypothetical protein